MISTPDNPNVSVDLVRTAAGVAVEIVRPQIRVTGSGMTDEKGAAVYTGFSVRSLQRFRQEGRGPAYRTLNRRIWYSLTALDEYLQLLEHDPVDD